MWLVAAGVALAVGWAVTRQKSRRKRLPKITSSSRVLLIGDSLAVGLASPLKRLAASRGFQLTGLGVSGSTLNAWVDRQLPQADLVLVSLGTNDAYLPGTGIWGRQQPLFLRLVDRIRSSGAKIVWIGPPTLPESYAGKTIDRNFLASLRDAAPNYLGADYLTLPRIDSLHPTPDGYEQWATHIMDRLS